MNRAEVNAVRRGTILILHEPDRAPVRVSFRKRRGTHEAFVDCIDQETGERLGYDMKCDIADLEHVE